MTTTPAAALVRPAARRTRLRPLRGAALAAVLTLGLAACSSAEAEWQTVMGEAATYSIEMPGAPERSTEPIPGSELEIQLRQVDLNGDAYLLSEIALPEGTPVDLDGAVDGALTSGLSSLEAQVGGSGAITEREVSTGSFGGQETRRFSAILTVDDVTATSSSIVFTQGDTLVQIAVIDTDGDNDAEATRFLDSLSEG